MLLQVLHVALPRMLADCCSRIIVSILKALERAALLGYQMPEARRTAELADACIEQVALGAVLQQGAVCTSPGDILVDANSLCVLPQLCCELCYLHSSIC